MKLKVIFYQSVLSIKFRSVYYEKRGYTISAEEKEKRVLIKEEHNEHLDKVLVEWTNFSTYGYIKMSKHLLREGYPWATEHAIRMIYKISLSATKYKNKIC